MIFDQDYSNTTTANLAKYCYKAVTLISSSYIISMIATYIMSVHLILGYVVRMLVIIQPSTKKDKTCG